MWILPKLDGIEANKTQLHSDAKRLFQKDGADEDEWEPHYDTKYRTRIQGVKHAKRDGTAFASVALPAHYSVIYAVLDHVKQRLGPTWSVERVIDWGAGVGSGLWLVILILIGFSGTDHFEGLPFTHSKERQLETWRMNFE
jgi:hypothetical protein